ncbi:MAG: AbrB/MazE/SpoVT family DNA-binding domain-containing protein [Chloroflexota bacterium]
MKTQIKKWGNSLALRIPKTYVDQMAFYPDSPVAITIIDGKLIIEPLQEPELTLDELLAQITADNVHREIDTGPDVGNEVW